MWDWLKDKLFRMANSVYRENQLAILKLAGYDSDCPRLLDIGCGNGVFTEQVAKQLGASEVYGIDSSLEKLEQAKGKRIKITSHDINNGFPYENDYFDVIISNQVVEHLYNLDIFFAEIFRILKRGGYAVISTPNLCSWHNIIFMSLGMQPLGMHVSDTQVGNLLKGAPAHGHIRLISAAALKGLARQRGFRVSRAIGSGYYCIPKLLSRPFAYFDYTHAAYIIIKIHKD